MRYNVCWVLKDDKTESRQLLRPGKPPLDDDGHAASGSADPNQARGDEEPN